jgi:hypothetical protein
MRRWNRWDVEKVEAVEDRDAGRDVWVAAKRPAPVETAYALAVDTKCPTRPVNPVMRSIVPSAGHR